MTVDHERWRTRTTPKRSRGEGASEWAVVVNTRRSAPRKPREEIAVSAGRFHDGHKPLSKKIRAGRPCLPSVASQKARASARGLDPNFVGRWFCARLRKAKAFGSVLDAEKEGSDLGVNDGSPGSGLTLSTPRGQESACILRLRKAYQNSPATSIPHPLKLSFEFPSALVNPRPRYWIVVLLPEAHP